MTSKSCPAVNVPMSVSQGKKGLHDLEILHLKVGHQTLKFQMSKYASMTLTLYKIR